MGIADAVVVEVTDATSVGDVRRRCVELSGRLGFDETRAGRVALIATEISTNLVKHARQGLRVIGRATEHHGALCVELLGIDAGPGIENVAQALHDGYSTTTTPGTGLGAVRRLADEFQLHSVPGAGTVVLARVFAALPHPGRDRATTRALDVSGIALAKPGEAVSGDAWAVEHGEEGSWLLVVDGLGHGPEAGLAAQTAVRAFRQQPDLPPAGQVRALHEALRGTRGAAVGVAAVGHRRREVVFAGLGNIAAAVVTPAATHNMVSHDGIAGHMAARIHEFTYAWPEGALLVMHSDGVNQRWDLGRYPGLIVRDPCVIAAVLLRDSSRGRDDATVVIARDRAAVGAARGRTD